MSVRAKFWVTGINHRHIGDDSAVNAEITLDPAYGEGNETWSKWTPAGKITLTITNPAAVEQFTLGDEFFVDFTPAA